jgi:hypothetical protein
LNGDITWPGLNRPETEVTAHQHRIDYWIRGRLGRDAFGFSVNWVFDNPTHDYEAGLGYLLVQGTEFGMRVRGPGGTANTDEWIFSGGLTNIGQVSPIREGARTSEITFRPSGPMKIDGVVIGTDLL